MLDVLSGRMAWAWYGRGMGVVWAWYGRGMHMVCARWVLCKLKPTYKLQEVGVGYFNAFGTRNKLDAAEQAYLANVRKHS